MPRFQLRIYVEPGEAEIFCKVLRKDGTYERLTAIIDTGAAVSLFPNDLLELINYRPTDRSTITIDQAGIARQTFQAIEGYIHIILEDQEGQVTQPVEIRAWFANTNHVLLGFADLLDQAILHIDMPQRNGWLDINF
jgi:hypothetical protein